MLCALTRDMMRQKEMYGLSTHICCVVLVALALICLIVVGKPTSHGLELVALNLIPRRQTATCQL